MGDKLFDAAIECTTRALDWSYRRQKVLASNLANRDTPGYRAEDLNFPRIMEEVYGSGGSGELNRTDPVHFPAAGGGASRQTLARPDQGRLDGNTVDLAQEMADLSENSYVYQVLLRSLTQKFKLLKSAIQGG